MNINSEFRMLNERGLLVLEYGQELYNHRNSSKIVKDALIADVQNRFNTYDAKLISKALKSFYDFKEDLLSKKRFMKTEEEIEEEKLNELKEKLLRGLRNIPNSNVRPISQEEFNVENNKNYVAIDTRIFIGVKFLENYFSKDNSNLDMDELLKANGFLYYYVKYRVHNKASKIIRNNKFEDFCRIDEEPIFEKTGYYLNVTIYYNPIENGNYEPKIKSILGELGNIK